VPAVTQPHCVRIDWGDEAATPALSCSAAGVAADYYLFESEQIRDDWYARTRDAHGGNAVGAKANNWQHGGEEGAAGLLGQWRCCLRPES
jgi:hypothetical protein